MERLASDNPSVGYIDTASVLYGRSSAQMFLDDCHLTDNGHRVVAESMASALEEMGVTTP